jgi:hypothetical protein
MKLSTVRMVHQTCVYWYLAFSNFFELLAAPFHPQLYTLEHVFDTILRLCDST